MTDGEDCGSLIDVERLIEVSKRSEAVLYRVSWVNLVSRP